MPLVSECLAQAASRLSAGPHPDRAKMDAETLLMAALGKDKAWLLAHRDEELPQSAASRFAEWIDWVDRRCSGEPIQYILGETEFYGLPFRVNRDVLIPRPETEHAVEKAAELALRFALPRIVDIGAGSGAIAVALAHKLPKASITAIDISQAALNVARANAERNGLGNRIRFYLGDLLDPIAEELFDIVVSNPPYVPGVDRDTLTVEVRDYEPAQALFAGDDGLAIYRRLIPAAWSKLVSGGFIVLEFGYGQEEAVRTLLLNAGFLEVEITADLRGIPRVASARRG
jgi:release factor glutamine methyltransferase